MLQFGIAIKVNYFRVERLTDFHPIFPAGTLQRSIFEGCPTLADGKTHWAFGVRLCNPARLDGCPGSSDQQHRGHPHVSSLSSPAGYDL